MSSLNKLPDVEFIDTDPNAIETDVITVYEAITGRKLSPADPLRLFLLTLAKIIIQQRVLINHTGKQNLLAYSSKNILDHKGAQVDTERLPAQPAGTTMRFILSTPQSQTVTIPAGIRVTPDGQLFFMTTNPTDIPIGTAEVEVDVECTIPGQGGNGWQPGQINRLVDPLPWIERVENITTSSGGADEEDDDRYRERIRQAPERFSTAGPDGAYKYWARTASQLIIDVSVRSPSPGVVEIRPLLQDGAIPDQEILNMVLETCSNKVIRPLTDNVHVLAPDQVSYGLAMTYYINSSDASVAASIQAKVHQAVVDYRIWQKSKLGRDIDPSELIYRVKMAGAKRVDVTNPVYTVVNKYQVAADGAVTVTYGGLEDD